MQLWPPHGEGVRVTANTRVVGFVRDLACKITCVRACCAVYQLEYGIESSWALDIWIWIWANKEQAVLVDHLIGCLLNTALNTWD